MTVLVSKSCLTLHIKFDGVNNFS